MKENNIIVEKSYDFAIKIVNCYKYLYTEKKEFVLSKQLLRSGTSIGAIIEDTIVEQSPEDFFAKLSMACKEMRKTNYWLRILRDTQFLDNKISESLLSDNDENLKLIESIMNS